MIDLWILSTFRKNANDATFPDTHMANFLHIFTLSRLNVSCRELSVVKISSKVDLTVVVYPVDPAHCNNIYCFPDATEHY